MRQQSIDFDLLERRSVRELWTPDEIFSEASGELLKLFYEDHRVERKPAGTHADALAIYVCMWANTPPDGGILVLGIEDDGTLTGCTAKAETLPEVERRIRAELVPDARMQTKRVQIESERGKPDFLILFRVEYSQDRLIETNKGQAWIRRVNSKHEL